jgi:hypothetical protein
MTAAYDNQRPTTINRERAHSVRPQTRSIHYDSHISARDGPLTTGRRL